MSRTRRTRSLSFYGFEPVTAAGLEKWRDLGFGHERHVHGYDGGMTGTVADPIKAWNGVYLSWHEIWSPKQKRFLKRRNSRMRRAAARREITVEIDEMHRGESTDYPIDKFLNERSLMDDFSQDAVAACCKYDTEQTMII